LGIDLGITNFATFSNGEKIANPKHFKQYEVRLAKEQQKLSKITNKEFKSYKKQKQKIYNVHKKIRNVRKDFLHKLTTNIVKNQNYTSYSIEDLAVKEMTQDNASPMSKAIGDAGFRMFRQQLTYKCEENGKNLLVIGRFDASSKTCSKCGHVYQELGRGEKEWVCAECKTNHNRDENAAKNIKNFGIVKSLGKDFSEA
jgi:putative transposase